MQYFLEKYLPIAIPPYSKVASFVYTSFDPAANAFAVELVGEKSVRKVDIVTEAPGFAAGSSGRVSASPEPHARSSFTDGLRVVLLVGSHPVALDQIADWIDW